MVVWEAVAHGVRRTTATTTMKATPMILLLVVDVAVSFEVAAPIREGPNGNDNDNQIASWAVSALG